jgi:hypothetical protein
MEVFVLSLVALMLKFLTALVCILHFNQLEYTNYG